MTPKQPIAGQLALYFLSTSGRSSSGQARYVPSIGRSERIIGQSHVLLADETRWPLLGVKGRKTTNHSTWALMGGDTVRYFILDSRGNDSGRKVFSGYRGVLVTDGYAVYKSLSKHENYLHAFCWSHCRRYFLAAEDTEPELAG